LRSASISAAGISIVISKPVPGDPQRSTHIDTKLVDEVRVSARGAFDHDTAYDRAVGPMQFLPRTWKGTGRDGNTDGTKDPNNIHDAALTTATYLCAHHRVE